MLKAVGKECDIEAAQAKSQMNLITPLRVRRKWADNFKYTPRILYDIFFGERGWGLTPKVLTESGQKEKKLLEKKLGLGRDELSVTKYLADIPQDQRYKKVSTSIDEHLKMFSSHAEAGPFLTNLRTKNKAEKIKSSYIDGFLKHLRPDGRFHPSYGLYVGSLYEWAKGGDKDNAGANTGRTSAKNPHVQTIPKRGKWAKKLRACYPAPEGEQLFNVDFSQGELKITACLADDPTMLQAYRDGQDLHLKTGARMAGISYEAGKALEENDPDEYERIRYGAKACNFGFVYRQSPGGFVNYAFREWDLEIPLPEAERQHKEFFDLYDRLHRWHNTYVQYAHKYQMVRNPLGRVRHLPLIKSKNRKLSSMAERQAINSPVQSTLSDLCLWAISIAELDMRLDREGLQIIGMTHDSIYGYIPIGQEHVVKRLADMMANLPIEDVFEWKPQLQFTVDAELGPTMGAMEKFDLAA